jgi:hypothetical protein
MRKAKTIGNVEGKVKLLSTFTSTHVAPTLITRNAFLITRY